jgi:thiol-disulfide isomerase/thioredoxin
MNATSIKTSFHQPHQRAAALLVALSLSAFTQSLSMELPPSLTDIKIYSAPADEGADLIGRRFEKWDVGEWINSRPLTLDSLRGKVVLIRWWTAPGCPFCEASAPALSEFADRYRDRGLVVIGLYHHKSDQPLTRSHVEEQARKLGFAFPVAIDPEWRTLRQWWLDKHDRGWTSVTILLDRRGIVNHVHPGGAFFKGEAGHDALEKKIKALLAEPEPSKL